MSIKITKELATKLDWELPSMMRSYDGEGTSGATRYCCNFCYRYTLSGDPIQHDPNCLGEQLAKQLTEQLYGEAH